MRTRKVMVDRQPVIPKGVGDCTVGREWHPLGYWVYFISSGEEGVREYGRKLREDWKMPEDIIDLPDGMEYYREICPFLEGDVVDGGKIMEIRLEEEDGIWFWNVIAEDEDE